MSANTILTGVVTGGVNNHTTTAEEANAIATDFVTQGVVGAITLNTGSGGTGSFCVNQDTSPDMGVTIKAGQAYITGTPSSQNSQVLRARAAADYTAYTINANASGSTKYDWIYLSVSATNANVPSATADNVTSIVTSRSSSNSVDNGTPPTYGLLLAIVTVANAASSITNSNITDRRFNSSIGAQNGSLIVTQVSTGVDAKVQAAGVDANVNLDLKTKGTGVVEVNDVQIGQQHLKNPYKFHAYRNGAFNVPASGAYRISLETKLFDTGSNFDSTTNFRFVAPVAGFYFFSGRASLTATGNDLHYAALYKNGVAALAGSAQISATNSLANNVSGLIQLAASDYVELYWYNGKAAVQAVGPGVSETYLTGFLVSAT